MARPTFTRSMENTKSPSRESGVGTGKFPRRGLNAVLEWYEIHKVELADDWERARKKLPLEAIDPLE